MENNHPLNILYFYLTKGCNLACRHCWINPKYQSEDTLYPSLGLGLFKSIIEQARPLGLSGVKLTGGEPLLHPDMAQLLEFLRVQELRLTMETNGVLCTEDMARTIAKCKRPFVCVSIDAADADTHEWIRGIKGSFRQAVEGVKNLVRAGLKPQIIMTLMRRNHSQMEAVVRLAEGLGAGSIKFNIVQPTSRGEGMHEREEVLDIAELVSLGEWVETDLSARTRLPIYYSHPVAFRPLGKMFGDRANSCGVCGILGILGVLANGSYALCGIGETVPELVFGDAAKDSLADVWNNTQALRELRENLPKGLSGVCGDCAMKNRCLGACVAQNYYRTKNLFAGFWYCEEAYGKGLFPKTRMNAIKKESL